MNRTASRRRWAVVSMGLLLTAGLPLLRGQESEPKTAPPKGDKPAGSATEQPAWARETEDSVKPLPLESIPDDPPPHEGALFEISYRIEPPDLFLVEVLEALPGRPITGERLVLPDGTICLQWYGDVHLAGLTTAQAKVKLVHHLRRYLSDQALGLISWDERGILPEGKPVPLDSFPPPPPSSEDFDRAIEVRPLPGGPREPAEPPPAPKEGEASKVQEKGSPRPTVPPGAATPRAGDAPKHGHFGKANEARTLKEPPFARVDGYDANPQPDGPVMRENPRGQYVRVDPAKSNRVFVDVTAYNSKVYYVLGDVGVPGRLPWTGKEMVLDAILHAGNLLPIADRHNIRLNRPARGDKPAKSYKIDFDAIERGEKKANLQMFPGDRLIIERKKHMEPRA